MNRPNIKDVEEFLKDELKVPKDVQSFSVAFDADGYMTLSYKLGPPSIYGRKE